MIDAFRQAFQKFRGFGDYSLSVPSLDGAFRPNSLLDDAEIVVEHAEPDNLVNRGGELHLSSGGALLRIDASGAVETLSDEGRAITALAAAPDGRLAVARSGGDIEVLPSSGSPVRLAAPETGSDVTALLFLRDGQLAAATGGKGRKAADWRLDLMSSGRSGAVWLLAADGRSRRICRDLAYPAGLVERGDGGLGVTLAWTHEIVGLDREGRKTTLASNLPGYPWRMISLARGGYLLTMLSIRNQLTEFVLNETAYLKRMTAEIAPDYWIAPQLRRPDSPLAVMQEGGQRIGGGMKPWAPSLSYGLVVRLGADFLPEASWHSRADGYRHGVNSVAEIDGGLYAASIGADAVIRLPDAEAAHEG